MSDQTPSKNDITAVFKRLRGIPSNKVCFDCGAKNPTWASVTYGVFICMDCSAVHRSLGVHLSFVRSTQLDINWTWLQLRAMQVGGNSNAISFFQQHGCSSTDAQQKYNSRAAQLYREKLHHQAATAIRLHGTKLHIDVPHVEQPHSPEQREVDFFKQHEDAILFQKETFLGGDLQNGSPAATTPSQPVRSDRNGGDIGPNVEAALSISPTEAQKQMETRKPTIASRKPAATKKGLGARKGLGAQKVSTNFNEIEKEAQKADQQREQTVTIKQQQQIPVSSEDEEKQLASVRLAYKDLSLQQKQTEEKLRQIDPKKAEQLERLGMGFAGVRGGGIAHSAASEMKIITQETPSQSSRNRDLDLDDDFEFISFTSGPPKYGDSPFLSRSSSDRFSDLGSKGSWSSDKSDRKSSVEMLLSSEKDPSSGRSRKSASGGSTPVSSTDEAQRKFGNAKAISSEQYFGSSRDNEFERRANLTRFEGSNSISSEDYFGDGSSNRNTSPSYSGPNLYDIKEGVKDGVNKVAGRLSSLANGVMNSLQDRYGY